MFSPHRGNQDRQLATACLDRTQPDPRTIRFIPSREFQCRHQESLWMDVSRNHSSSRFLLAPSEHRGAVLGDGHSVLSVGSA